jgi:hypothetical protein
MYLRQTKYSTGHVHLTTCHIATAAGSITRPFVICTVYLLVDYIKNVTVEKTRNEHNRNDKTSQMMEMEGK